MPERKKKITLSINEPLRNSFGHIFKMILETINKGNLIEYLISIDGLEVTLEEYLLSCHSRNYHIFDNGNYNFFIKKLPTLYLLSDDWKDVQAFHESIGSFSEGTMRISFVHQRLNGLLLSTMKKSLIEDFLIRDCIICVSILPGSEIMEITSYDCHSSLESIAEWFKQIGTEGNLD